MPEPVSWSSIIIQEVSDDLSHIVFDLLAEMLAEFIQLPAFGFQEFVCYFAGFLEHLLEGVIVQSAHLLGFILGNMRFNRRYA